MQRFKQKFLPTSFDDTWVFNAIRNIGENDIQLWNFNQLQPVHSNLVSLDIFPLFNFPKIWQDFPDEQIKITQKTSEFDAKLKNYFINDLEDTVICNRLLCPACLSGRLIDEFSVFSVGTFIQSKIPLKITLKNLITKLNCDRECSPSPLILLLYFNNFYMCVLSWPPLPQPLLNCHPAWNRNS